MKLHLVEKEKLFEVDFPNKLPDYHIVKALKLFKYKTALGEFGEGDLFTVTFSVFGSGFEPEKFEVYFKCLEAQ